MRFILGKFLVEYPIIFAKLQTKPTVRSKITCQKTAKPTLTKQTSSIKYLLLVYCFFSLIFIQIKSCLSSYFKRAHEKAERWVHGQKPHGIILTGLNTNQGKKHPFLCPSWASGFPNIYMSDWRRRKYHSQFILFFLEF